MSFDLMGILSNSIASAPTLFNGFFFLFYSAIYCAFSIAVAVYFGRGIDSQIAVEKGEKGGDLGRVKWGRRIT